MKSNCRNHFAKATLLCGSLITACAVTTPAHSFDVSGGLDLRVKHETTDDQVEGGLDGAFLNLRNVWGDDEGDRWIAVAQLDVSDNANDIDPYQIYLQYKGPLGKWNLRAGHFLLPFGLLTTYDTERLLLGGLEPLSIGIRKDSGVEALGHDGNIDYAVSVTEGMGDDWFGSRDGNKLFTGRVAYVPDHDWQIGISLLQGLSVIDIRQCSPHQE